MWLVFEMMDEGLITCDQLCEALKTQMRYRRPLGQLVQDASLMTMSQIFDVLATQHDWNRPFGEVAVELGYLTSEQLGMLLLRQSNGLPRIEELLVQAEVVSAEVMQQWVSNHRARSGLLCFELPELVASTADMDAVIAE